MKLKYQTKQSSFEEALIKMFLTGVSVRRVEDITEALRGAKVSSSTVSDLNQKIYSKIESWRMQPILAGARPMHNSTLPAYAILQKNRYTARKTDRSNKF